MKICFAGLGSIARRHIRNLHELIPEAEIDVLRHGRRESEERIDGITGKFFYSPDELSEVYDVIFITNPTSMHYELLNKLHDKGKHFFIEKPVFLTGYEDIGGLKLRKESVYYVACPLRYTNVLQYIKKNIDLKKIYSLRSISSSYLPSWRPGTDYRTTYSANKDMGGGVELDLIHEWDYLIWLCGYPDDVHFFTGKKSNLEITSNDIAVYIAEYKNKMIELHLDYFGRKPIRRLELFGMDDSIIVDLIDQKIFWLNSGRELVLMQDRDDYQKSELKAFLDMIEGTRENDNDITNACHVLRLAGGKI